MVQVSTLGPFVQGMMDRERLEQQNRSIAVQEKQQAAQEKQQAAQEFRNQLDLTLKAIDQVRAVSGQLGPKSQQAIAQAFQLSRNSLHQRATQLGIPTETIDNIIASRIQGAEQARAKGRLAAQEQLGQIESLVGAGIPVEQARLTAGIEVPKAKPPSAAQSQAAGFAARTEESSAIIDELGSEFTGFGAGAAGLLPQQLKSEERQKFEQASKNFINATLRRESGATITSSEEANAKAQYIPQRGDEPEVLEQKRRNRIAIVEALKLEAGPEFEKLKSKLPPISSAPGATPDGKRPAGKIKFLGFE